MAMDCGACSCVACETTKQPGQSRCSHFFLPGATSILIKIDFNSNYQDGDVLKFSSPSIASSNVVVLKVAFYLLNLLSAHFGFQRSEPRSI